MKKERLAQFFRSRFFLGIVIGVVCMLLVFCIFEAGVAFGYHEALFSGRWGENYGKNFGEPEDSVGLPSSHTPFADGNVGTILSITPANADAAASTTTFVLESAQRPEEKVVIDGDTVIRNREDTIQASDLTVGMQVVVIGEPNDQGQIVAKLIRVLPAGSSQPSTGAPNQAGQPTNP
jgi:hypothetical protein